MLTDTQRCRFVSEQFKTLLEPRLGKLVDASPFAKQHLDKRQLAIDAATKLDNLCRKENHIPREKTHLLAICEQVFHRALEECVLSQSSQQFNSLIKLFPKLACEIRKQKRDFLIECRTKATAAYKRKPECLDESLFANIVRGSFFALPFVVWMKTIIQPYLLRKMHRKEHIGGHSFDDIVQNVAAKLLKRFLREPCAFSALYVQKTVDTAFANALKDKNKWNLHSRGEKNGVPMQTLLPETPGHTQSSWQRILTDDFVCNVIELLRMKKPPAAKALRLYHFNNWNEKAAQEQATQEFGWKESTFNCYLSSARQFLRRQYERKKRENDPACAILFLFLNDKIGKVVFGAASQSAFSSPLQSDVGAMSKFTRRLRHGMVLACMLLAVTITGVALPAVDFGRESAKVPNSAALGQTIPQARKQQNPNRNRTNFPRNATSEFTQKARNNRSVRRPNVGHDHTFRRCCHRRLHKK